ncbi:hypothetical protein CKO10_18115, partial [Rhodospirillum rubrum]|nr:hypothetical protein [Rhodospirillum rubrum]
MKMSRIRLLPVMIFVGVLMLTVRVGAVWQGVEKMGGLRVGHSEAMAQATP